MTSALTGRTQMRRIISREVELYRMMRTSKGPATCELDARRGDWMIEIESVQVSLHCGGIETRG